MGEERLSHSHLIELVTQLLTLRTPARSIPLPSLPPLDTLAPHFSYSPHNCH